jgi:hypothetical protein
VTTAYSRLLNKRATGAMSQLPCQEMYIKSARVVQAAGDNSLSRLGRCRLDHVSIIRDPIVIALCDSIF